MNYLYWIIVVLLFIISILLYVIVSQRVHFKPAYVEEQYTKITNQFRFPTYAVKEKSVWKDVPPLYEIILYNSGLDTNEHSVVVVGIKMDVPIDKLFTLFSVAKIVWYQQVNNVMYVRSDDFLRCLLILQLIKEYISTDMTQTTLQESYQAILTRHTLKENTYSQSVEEVLKKI
jgi:hypothetical protein